MTIYSSLLWISGAIVAIAVVLYFIGTTRALRIPSVVLGVIGGMGFGAVLGLGLSSVYEKELNGLGPNDSLETEVAGATKGANAPPGAPGVGGMGGGMMGGGGGGGFGGGGRGPNPKNQLVQFVTKLDQLTLKPLVVTLDDSQKAKVQEQLKDLGSMEELTADQAKSRLDALLAIVEGQRETFEAAGYRWPGGGGPPGAGGPGRGGPPGGPGGASQARNDNGRPGSAYGPPGDAPNPFSVDTNAVHLKALNDRLATAPEKPAAAE